MSWILTNIFNCMMEGAALFFLGNLFEDRRFRMMEYVRYFCSFIIFSFIITLTDLSGRTSLPINFLWVFSSFFFAFYRCSVKTLLGDAALAFICLLNIQFSFVCILPQKWLAWEITPFLVNSLTLGIAFTIYMLSMKQNWSQYYKSNSKSIWLCIVTLCAPTIITSQIAVWGLYDFSRSTLVILFLLQLLYLSVIIVLLLLSNRRSEQKQQNTTQKHIEELNAHLDDSRQRIHDFNKHLRFLRNTVVTNSQNENLIEIVTRYCKDLITIYDEEEILLQLASPIFRALLYGRRTQAVHNSIRFDLKATAVLPSFPVTNYQLVEIFDNIMNNAFECVIELPEEMRWIQVNLSTTIGENGRNIYEMRIENPYKELDISAVLNGKQYSSKKGHAGIGLQRVSQLVAKTGGKLIIATPKGKNSNIFAIKIQYTEQ